MKLGVMVKAKVTNTNKMCPNNLHGFFNQLYQNPSKYIHNQYKNRKKYILNLNFKNITRQ